LAVKVGLWFRRVRFDISAPDPRHPRRAQAENPLSRSYSPHSWDSLAGVA
jgi:hypothetical protein